MEQEQRGENGTDDQGGKDKQPEPKPLWSVSGTALAIQIYLVVLFFLWMFIPDFVPAQNAATVFIESAFSVAIVDVIVVHAIMYYKQAKEANRQAEIAGTSLMVSEQSYVGVHSIADRSTRQGNIILITLENIGHVPADEISVNIHLNGLLLDRAMIPPDARTDFGHVYNDHFGRTNCFPAISKSKLCCPMTNTSPHRREC